MRKLKIPKSMRFSQNICLCVLKFFFLNKCKKINKFSITKTEKMSIKIKDLKIDSIINLYSNGHSTVHSNGNSNYQSNGNGNGQRTGHSNSNGNNNVICKVLPLTRCV